MNGLIENFSSALSAVSFEVLTAPYYSELNLDLLIAMNFQFEFIRLHPRQLLTNYFWSNQYYRFFTVPELEIFFIHSFQRTKNHTVAIFSVYRWHAKI
jgi:hypothetical protein